MSYEIKKPITEKERNDFIVEYNHNRGLKIEDSEYFLFALEPNEIMGEKEIEIEVPDFETVEEEYSEFVPSPLEGEGEAVNEVESPNYTGEGEGYYETKTRTVQRQTGTHTETITVPYPVVDPDYEEKQAVMERQRLDALTLTPADVERALYRSKGMDFEDLKALIAERAPQLDMKGLAIEFRANLFYRGVEIGGMRLIDTVGALLGYTPEDMDYLFEHKELPQAQ